MKTFDFCYFRVQTLKNGVRAPPPSDFTQNLPLHELAFHSGTIVPNSGKKLPGKSIIREEFYPDNFPFRKKCTEFRKKITRKKSNSGRFLPGQFPLSK